MDQANIEFPRVDIYYSNKDITSLRWLSEVKKEISKYKTSVIFNSHELNSDHARRKNISSEQITLNNKIILMHQLKTKIYKTK